MFDLWTWRPFAWAGEWEGVLTIFWAIALENAACLLGVLGIAAWDRWAKRR